MVILDMPFVAAQHARHIPSVTTAVSGGAVSGWETGGAVGGLLGGVAAIIGIVLSVIGMNRKNRQQYNQEIDAAETRGEQRGLKLADDNRRDMEFWRGIALGSLQQSGRPIPVPPSQQPSYPPLRPLPDDDEEVGV